MISIKYVLATKPRMSLELMQAMGSMIVKLQNVEGCSNIDFMQDELDENQFYFRMDWQNKVLFKSLLNSNEFSVFEGSIDVLCFNPTVEIISTDNRVLKILKKNFKKELQKEFNN
jgi:quinol monooxygenase YgiN